MSEITQEAGVERREFWRLVFESHRGSGLTVRQFCRREGLAEWSFYYWRKKLGPSGRGGGVAESIRSAEEIAGSSTKDTGRAKALGEFIEFSLPASSLATGQLRFSGGCVLQFDLGISQRSLTAILSSLRELGLC